MDKIRIGVSACLLGEPVRYDGRDKRDRFLTGALGRRFECVGVCPETECGLGVPREPMWLTGDPARPRLVTVHTGQDRTARMRKWIARRVADLERENLCGFVFKSRSPSCGQADIEVRRGKGGRGGRAPGLFARAFQERFPALPCVDEERLSDADVRRNFIERVLAVGRFRRTARAGSARRRGRKERRGEGQSG